MYYITEGEVSKNLRIGGIVDILKDAFIEYGKGKAESSSRDRLIVGKTLLNTMPAVIEKYGLAGLKTYVATPNGAKFAVLLFDTNSSNLLAVIEANTLGQLRTGALPAMVTKLLVKKNHPIFTLIGSGFQAETQLSGMLSQFDVEEVRVYSRNYENAAKFVKRQQELYDTRLVAFKQVGEALKDADIINTITTSREAIFDRSQIGEEYLVNLAGGNLPFRREVAQDVLIESDLLVVEHMGQAMKESGDVITFTETHADREIVELKDFVSNLPKYAGSKRTVFKSMGIGIEDVATGYLLLKNMGLL